MSGLGRAVAVWLAIGASVPIAPFNLCCSSALADPEPTIYPEFNAPGPRQDIPHSQLLQYVERGQVYRVLLQGNIVTAELVDGRFVRSAVEGDDGLLLSRLKFKGVGVASEL
jgi:hypothetical protein